MIGNQFLQNMCELSLAYARGQSFENTGDFQESGWGKDAVKRRIACLFLAVVLAAALLGGCTDTGEPVVTQMGEGTYKIAIITGTTSQGEEEYRAAEGMKQMYGDRIVTSVYPDNAAQETEVTMQPASYTPLRAHEPDSDIVCRLLLEKKKSGKQRRSVGWERQLYARQ